MQHDSSTKRSTWSIARKRTKIYTKGRARRLRSNKQSRSGRTSVRGIKEMAFRVLRLVGITNSFRNYGVEKGATICSLVRKHDFLKPHIPLVEDVKNTSFFNKRPAEQLWKGVTSVSNAGRRRGRARGLTRKKDLNKGQSIGDGKIKFLFPGLNTPVVRGKEVMSQQRLPDDPNRDEKLRQLRDSMGTRKVDKNKTLLRGWTSHKPGGSKVGPPKPEGEETFEGFESWVLEYKFVSTMTGNLGRKSRISTTVVTGNGNGLVGYATAKTKEGKHAITLAKNRAGHKLLYIHRYNDHTVLHDFYTQCGKTKIFVHKKEEGYGLVCHRVIKCICEAVGIKDLHAKVEGSVNYQNIVKAFIIGLQKQKTFQEMADEKQLHLVEFREENDSFPFVVASPARVRKIEEIKQNEILDFSQYLMNGKVVLKKRKYPPFYTQLDSWASHLKNMERIRNKKDVKLRLLAEYGTVRSFLADKYPEAREILWSKKRVQAEKEAKGE
ncbi:hypothetical protein KPH14_002196 [Odynerus spinipes]|uniref:Small ribosomal subunit protein uS5m n=1 Tax=Odynerus spinipes TaxID=1348599 RepID=A0AAD9RLK8_9HYME|nr:hypothetical protein KPH14_002196 [Odynerus spinipes]